MIDMSNERVDCVTRRVTCLDCVIFVKIRPFILNTLRQTKFSSHAVYGAVPNYTIDIWVGNWGSKGCAGSENSDSHGRDFATPGLELQPHAEVGTELFNLPTERNKRFESDFDLLLLGSALGFQAISLVGVRRGGAGRPCFICFLV